MKEQIFNLFLIGDENFIRDLGIVGHNAEGDDSSKVEMLQLKVNEDYKIAKRYPLPSPVSWNANAALFRMGDQLKIFEKLFVDFEAPLNPLFVITSIVNDVPRIEGTVNVADPNPKKDESHPLAKSTMSIDWLQKYSKDGALDLPRLFDDDYFVAIRLLFNADHFVSAAKLVMSFIDTVAFIDLGDTPGNFSLWLDKYAKLSSIGITSGELWEFRNGLLHMTNLSSRGVLKGKTAPLILFVGGPPGYAHKSVSGEKYFNLLALLDVIANAVGEWISTYNADPDKFEVFVQRYDLTISDSRTLVATL